VSTSEALTYQLPQQLVDDGTIRMWGQIRTVAKIFW
jgi:hypothetical protein